MWQVEDGGAGCHSALAGAERQEVVASVQRACSNTPAHTLVAMQENPVPCCSDGVVLAIVRYIVEHRLHTWVGQQNAVQGVAPSRAQLIDQALALVPSSVPDMIRKKVVAAWRPLQVLPGASAGGWPSLGIAGGCAWASSRSRALFQSKRSRRRTGKGCETLQFFQPRF